MPASKIKIVCRHVLEHENIRPFGARMGVGVGGGVGVRGQEERLLPQSFLKLCFFSKSPLNVPFLKILNLK